MTSITRIGKAHWEERGKRIEQARGFAGYTSQEDLAEVVSKLLDRKIGRQVIYIIEAGDRDIRADELRAIAVAVGQSEDWLDGIEGAGFNASAERLRPEFVVPLKAPLGRRTVDYGTFPSWYEGPIAADADDERLRAA
jgi:hypothetical protein